MNTTQMLREAEENERKAAEARKKVYQYNYALHRAAEASLCGKCAHHFYSCAFGYTFCNVVEDESGQYRSWDSILSLNDKQKIQCSSFKERGK